jgi:hypothetical protein
MLKAKYIPLLLLAFLLSACKKNEQYIPNAYVNLTIYVNDPQNIALSTVGGYKYFDGGYRGVVVYRKGQNEFIAYDRACPYNVEESSSVVTVDTTNNVILKDFSCESQFLLSDGTNISGPALIPLRVFRSVFDGTVLRVTNN